MLVIVAESVNCWSAFIVPVAIVEIVAESIKAESAFINPVDSCLTCPESKVNLSMFAESTSKSPIATLLKNALSPEEITKLVAARLPIVAESKVAFLPVRVVFAILVIVALSAVRLFPIATLPENTIHHRIVNLLQLLDYHQQLDYL